MIGSKLVFGILLFVCYVQANRDGPGSELLEARENDYTGECGRGRDGRDGRDSIVPGPPGPPGTTGPRGPPGPTGSSGGTVYTRWGRKSCPEGATLLYEGIMGGSHYTHAGGGANYLCMPLDPIYDKTINGNQGYSYLFGIEYEMNAHAPLFPKNLHDHEAVCAVCFVETRSSQVMIPARNVCPGGWTLEYKGYLMSEHHGHKRSQFICVDGEPEARQGTNANLNGGLLYVVESHCGALPCLPYKQGAELTCAVCTK